MKLSKRLEQIDKMILGEYSHIWDTCCDHGLLGASLLKRSAADMIHFVDISSCIMEKLESSLIKYFPEKIDQWKVHTISATELPITKNNRTQVVIIAGVGGELVISIVKNIIQRVPDIELEFLISPVHHNYEVRSELINMGFKLVDECLIEENKRFYEILHISKRGAFELTKVGSKMWDLSKLSNTKYLTQTIEHYKRMQKNPNMDLLDIINAYENIK